MGFTSVRINNFRNLKNQELCFSSKEVFLVGKNGQGKTNFLELLYFLCYASSFRSKRDRSLIQEGQDFFYISGQFHHLESLSPSRIDVSLDRENKKIRLNGKKISDRKDVLANIPCIVFCHNDMYFVNGNPDNKRTYLDQCLSLHDPLYINTLREYKKIMRERNFILKKGDPSLLPIFTEQLVRKGIPLVERRKELFDFLNKNFGQYFRKVSGKKGKIELVYNRSWKEMEKESILENLKKREAKELDQGLTLSGPHRDSFSLLYEGKDYLEFASTGQLRIISLLFRILQSEYYERSTGRNPILLVDDVLLELDEEKRQRMMEIFPRYEQIFYTFLPSYFEKEKREGMFIRVEEGRLKVENG